MLTGTLLAVAAMMQASPTAAPRQQFVACLRTTVTKATNAKMKPDQFDSVARTDCAAQITSFRSALVAFDVKNGRPRKAAETDADQQITDYVVDYSTRLDAGS